MKISFVWDNNPPQPKVKSNIEERFSWGLKFFADTCNLKPEKFVVHQVQV